MTRMDTNADPDGVDTNERLDELDVALGAELRGLRSKRGLSQRELAQRTGISERTIIRVESGERAMNIRQLYALCRALGIKPSRLINAVEIEVGIE